MALPLIAGIAGTALSIGGSIYGAKQAKKAKKQEAEALRDLGLAEQAASEFEASQLDVAAGQQLAAGQVAAQDELRKMMLLQSKALAIAGASGAGTSDPLIVAAISNIAKEGQYSAELAKYQGTEAARGLRLDAVIKRWEGRQQAEGRMVQARTSVKQGKAIQTQGILDAAAAGLQGVAQWGGKF